MTARHQHLLRRATGWLLEAGAAAAFLGVVGHHVHTLNFRPLAAFFLPVLVVFFGFTSLLFMRGRSLARSKEQLRTLFAAERAMQATVWYVTGMVLGVSLYALVPASHSPWLLVFVLPYALMQVGLVLFVRAAWVIAPQFLRPVGRREIWRRIAREPA